MLMAAFVTLTAGSVVAQGPGPQIGLGAGYNHLWYAETPFDAIGLRASVRLPVSPSVSLEPEVTYGHGTETEHFGATSTTSGRTTWSAGVNMIWFPRRGQPQLRPYLGGGGGLFMQRRLWQTVIANGPGAGVFRTTRIGDPWIAGQALVGVEADVFRHTAIFGELRVDAFPRGTGPVGFWYLGGVRVALR